MTEPRAEGEVLALIPVRERDLIRDGVPVSVAGRTLLEHTLAAARGARRLTRVVVTTDTAAVADLARRAGADVPFLRPAELAAPHVPLSRVLQHGLTALEAGGRYRADAVVLLEVSHPVRPAGLVDRVVETLLGSDLDSVFTAYEDPHMYWAIDDQGEFYTVQDRDDTTRAGRRPLFRELSGMVCASRAEVIRGGAKLGRRVGLVPVRGWLGLVDTQDEMGLWLAERMLTTGETPAVDRS